MPGAGLGFVDGTMNVCARPRCGTNTPPCSGWLALNHQIHGSTRLSAICVDERLELPHKSVSCCGVWQGNHGEEPVWVDVLEVFPEGRHQSARGSVDVNAVKRPQFRVVKGVRVPPLCRSRG